MIFLWVLIVSVGFASSPGHEREKTAPPPCSDSTEVKFKNQSDTVPDLSNKAKWAFLEAYIQHTPKIGPNKKAGPPFDTLDYNKVIAYDYVGREEGGPSTIVGQGYNYISGLGSTIKRQKALGQDKAEWLTHLICQKSTYGGSKAACFEPHLGIVFFKDSVIVADLSICLACNYLVSSIDIPANPSSDLAAWGGFSDAAWNKLNDMCKEFNFYSYPYHKKLNQRIMDSEK